MRRIVYLAVFVILVLFVLQANMCGTTDNTVGCDCEQTNTIEKYLILRQSEPFQTVSVYNEAGGFCRCILSRGHDTYLQMVG
jgi:hypothetical protein